MEALTLEAAKDGSGYILISCDPDAKQVEIPPEVKVIAKGAFDGCYKLKNLIVSDGVERIECGALEGCRSLRSITIPFVGESRNAKGYKAHFGYIFGVKEYENPKLFSQRSRINWRYDDREKLYDYPIPESLVSITLSESCTELRDYAFYKCYDVEKIELPGSMSGMGAQAFSLCKKLREVVIPKGITEIGNYYFVGCESLKRVVLPSSVTRIGEYAFPRGESMNEVVVRSKSVSVGERAFACSYISHLVIRGNIKPTVKKGTDAGAIIASVFEDCRFFDVEISSSAIPYISGRKIRKLTISDGDISDGAFSGLSTLEELVIGDGVTVVGDRAFMGCEGLRQVTLAEGIESIGDHAFDNCGRVEKLVIPDSVRSIGKYAFRSCEALLSVTLGERVVSIGECAFDLCRSLSEVINFSPLVITAGSEEHGGVAASALAVRGTGESFDTKDVSFAESRVFEIDGFVFNEVGGEYYLTLCKGWEYILRLPTHCNGKPYKVNKSAFESNERIDRLIINGGVTEIGTRAFANCKCLKSVEIVGGVSVIGESAFFGCSNLKRVYIGDGVESVGESAFEECDPHLRICVKSKKRPKGWSKHWTPKSTEVKWKYREKKDKLANWYAVHDDK